MLIHAKITFLKGLINDIRFDEINRTDSLPMVKKPATRKARTSKPEKANSELLWVDIFYNADHIPCLLKLLINNGFVSKDEQERYTWLRQEDTYLRTVVALCLTLHKKGYIDFKNKTKVAFATMNQLYCANQ